jgi:hypothetical protein
MSSAVAFSRASIGATTRRVRKLGASPNHSHAP